MEEKRIYNLYYNEMFLGTFYGNNILCLKDLLSKKFFFEADGIVANEVDRIVANEVDKEGKVLQKIELL